MREFSVVIAIILILFIIYIAVIYLGKNQSTPASNTATPTQQAKNQQAWSWSNFYVQNQEAQKDLDLGYEPETTITSSPKNNELVDAEEIMISFGGLLLPNIDDTITIFEYRLNGSGWRSTYTNFQKISLVPGEIKFEVRAKTKKGAVDSSPASVIFKSNLSQWHNDIQISQIKKPTQGDALSGLIYLTNRSREMINLVGWTIKTKENEFKLPQANEYLDLNNLGNSSVIKLQPNDTAIIGNKNSPLTTSFKINKCTGYLTYNYNFIPPINKACPLAKNYNISNLSRQCQEYINRLSSCETPNPGANNPGVANDSACVAFLNKLNYGSCYLEYKNNLDFLSKEWRVYLNSSFPMIKSSYEEIRLYDGEQKLVNIYKY